MSAKSTTSVALVLSRCVLQGEIVTNGARVVDVLNDQNTRFLEVEKAGIFQRDDSDIIASVAKTSVIKDNLQIVLLAEESGPGDREPYYATLARHTVKAVITLPVSVVEGRLHMKSAHNPQTFLSIEAPQFIPITDATIHHFSKAASRLTSRVAMVNKAAISSLSFAP